MGRRCGVGIRAAHRRQQSRPRWPHRGDATRPGASAAAGKGAPWLCRGRSGSALRRRRRPGRSQIAAAKPPVVIYVELQSRHAVSRRATAAPGRLPPEVRDADRSVPLVGASGKRLRVHLASAAGPQGLASLTADASDNRQQPRDCAASGRVADAAVRCRAAGTDPTCSASRRCAHWRCRSPDRGSRIAVRDRSCCRRTRPARSSVQARTARAARRAPPPAPAGSPRADRSDTRSPP